MERTTLGVNVDHVATIRQARGTDYPDPVAAAIVSELAGADQITVHLREDRRHIQERDVRILKEVVTTRLNLEIAITREMIDFALEIRPHMVTLVPERREERTTEGGLDAIGLQDTLPEIIRTLSDAGIIASLFVDPHVDQVQASVDVGAPMIELHTGDYAHAQGATVARELARLRSAATHGVASGLLVAAGHGLGYRNVGPIARLPEIIELNIGHSIVARSLFVGLDRAVREMLDLIRAASPHGSIGS
jgi:pyridoxine 5-phosphate synthase